MLGMTPSPASRRRGAHRSPLDFGSCQEGARRAKGVIQIIALIGDIVDIEAENCRMVIKLSFVAKAQIACDMTGIPRLIRLICIKSACRLEPANKSQSL